jgi:DNA-binding transcriptional LysR family regulator
MRRSYLRDLDTLAAVARHRSFRGAARELGVSASTLSQQVRDLEDGLGTRLLHRTTRSVAPTEAGQRLLDRVAPALATIELAVDHVHESAAEPAGTIRINAPLPAVELVLAPLLGPFLATHPRVRVELTTDAALVDIVAAGYDAGVRWDEDLAQDVTAVPLGGPQSYAVVAAPDLLARAGPPAHPEDLLGQPCLRQIVAGGVALPWEFERDGRVLRLRPDGPLASTSIRLQHRAALDGVGFWAIFEQYVREDIAAGRLVRVLEAWCPPFSGPFLYYPRHRYVPAPLAALVRFLRQRRRAAPEPGLPEGPGLR